MLDAGSAGLAAGPFVAACALLVVAGAAKVARPAPARAAVAAAGLRVPGAAVVALGVTEIAAGAGGVLFGRAAAIVVALSYVALAAFAVRLVRRAPSTPCACLGSSTATVSRAHVLVDVAAAGVALVAASGGSPLARLGAHPFAAVVFVALTACCVKLAALTLDALPVLARAIDEGAT